MAFKDPEARRRYLKGWHAANRDKINAKHRERWPAYYAANKDKKLAQWRRRHKKEGLAGRPAPDLCEICGNPPGKRKLAFDHHHQKGHFRGWICSNCNCALGLVRDDVQHLRKLIAYLARTGEGVTQQFTLAGI